MKGVLTIETIYSIVCDYFNMPVSEAQEKTRKRERVQVRQIAHHFCNNYTKHSFAYIGKKIGEKDHATVMHSCRTVKNLYQTDSKYRNDVDEIEKRIKTEIDKIMYIRRYEITKEEIKKTVRDQVFARLLQVFPPAKQKAKKYEAIQSMLL